MNSASEAATRVAAGDDHTRYDRVSISLHWLTAILVVTEFATAQVWGYLPRPERHILIVGHMSFGIILTCVIFVRLLWRAMPRHRVKPLTCGWVELASRAVHYLLYGLLVTQATLGFALRWSGNEALSLFGLLLPSPFGTGSKALHQTVAEAHEWTGWTLIVIATAHASAALYHHYILKDAVLRRMLLWGRDSSTSRRF